MALTNNIFDFLRLKPFEIFMHAYFCSGRFRL